ncbi:ab4a8de0-556f-4490-be6c-06e11aed8f2c [Sclerotinia trifoliorum]|uniref:Ab4a8de0-556f-4490-be6c-06e11aed8f2c n=1 Tax=Sclerotinia trifoliorum TaxID=28548 RepID=A0A8H2ZN37_9HELO|nr:ab4a8de0-556f-4490-be6c-06e11aed8f2c [Sclerotinia trifoliorum]
MQAIETSKVNRAEIPQPLCTALQIAVFNMFNATGVQPSAVVSHSSGEIAAAYATDAIGMEEAIIIAYYPGFVTTNQKLKGAMVVVGLGSEEVSEFFKPGVVIAREYSPDSASISWR